MAGDYDAIYFGLQTSTTDPDPDFWLSSGPYHFWNPGQAAPATPWEARINELMREQTTAADLARRQNAFKEVQQVFADELPSIYFVAPRVTIAPTPRVLNPVAAPLAPHLLWNADTLAAAREGGRGYRLERNNIVEQSRAHSFRRWLKRWDFL